MSNTSQNKTKNKLATAIYFLSSIIWLNILESSLTTNSVGVAFIIATVYGIICISKKSKFLF